MRTSSFGVLNIKWETSSMKSPKCGMCTWIRIDEGLYYPVVVGTYLISSSKSCSTSANNACWFISLHKNRNKYVISRRRTFLLSFAPRPPTGLHNNSWRWWSLYRSVGTYSLKGPDWKVVDKPNQPQQPLLLHLLFVIAPLYFHLACNVDKLATFGLLG